MPEYLAPGVIVEETSFRAKSIEGVGTSTTGFAGPTRKGPVGGHDGDVVAAGDRQLRLTPDLRVAVLGGVHHPQRLRAAGADALLGLTLEHQHDLVLGYVGVQ